MAGTINNGDLMFLADEDTKFMKEIEAGSFAETVAGMVSKTETFGTLYVVNKTLTNTSNAFIGGLTLTKSNDEYFGAGTNGGLLIKKSGYYHVSVKVTWSSVTNVASTKVITACNRAYINTRYAETYGRDDSWETRSASNIAYIEAGTELTMGGRAEDGGSTIYTAEICVMPVTAL